jgi:hypothetical protein
VAAPSDSLDAAFQADHRDMTRGFARLRKVLETGEWTDVLGEARALDRRVGAHMEFEETAYYPALIPSLGEETVATLYDEHDAGRAILEEILAAGDAPPVEPDRRRLMEGIDGMLGHAATCGTLVSHLARLSDSDRRDLLGTLIELRAAGHRWTELGRIGRQARPRAEAQ